MRPLVFNWRFSSSAAALNIESRQDTAKFDSTSQSTSVSGVAGWGASVSASYSQSNVGSDYGSCLAPRAGCKAGMCGAGFRSGAARRLRLRCGLLRRLPPRFAVSQTERKNKTLPSTRLRRMTTTTQQRGLHAVQGKPSPCTACTSVFFHSPSRVRCAAARP